MKNMKMSNTSSSSSEESDSELYYLIESDSDDHESDEDTQVCVYEERVDYPSVLGSCEFQIRFRLNKRAVEQLMLEIYPYLKVTGARNYGVTPIHQLLLTLRFYALGTVADYVGVSKESACHIVHSISSAIAQLYGKYIYMHANTEQDFYTIARFPRVLGAIDSTHIKIQSTCSQMGEEFRNQKGYFSLNVQGVCNAQLLFMNVVARWPGSADDGTIFNLSQLRAQCESGMFENKWLLGDSAYPLKPYLLTPLFNPQTKAQHLYNEAHVRTRKCIDRCFRVWKQRFPVVGLTLHLSLLQANAVIIATAVLHNICRLAHLDEVPPEVEINDTDSVSTDNRIDEIISTERETLIADYFDNL